MKLSNIRIKKLKLTRQLFIVTIVSLALLLAFFFFFLTGQIKSEVTRQMDTNLERAQEQIIRQHAMEGKEFTIRFSSDPSIVHIIYDSDTNEYVNIGKESYNTEVFDYLSIELNNYIVSNDSEVVKGSLKSDSNYVYRISEMGSDSVILSATSGESVEALRQSLMNSMMLVSLLLVIILFGILALWILAVIRPLSETQKYIEGLKDGKEIDLEINREDEIGDLMHAVVEMHEELAKQDAVKQDMIHNISHDLKTPISTIKSYAESIKDGIYPYETLEKSIDVIIENSERLERKVYTLLYMNRVDYLLSKDDGVANIKNIIEKVVKNAEVKASEIDIQLDLQNVSFRGNTEAWQVAVENIFDNALRYAHSYIRIILRPGSLSISNDGLPINEEQLPFLFKPFEKGIAGQFGLGLSITNKIAKNTEYKLQAFNTSNGVRFEINDTKREQ